MSNRFVSPFQQFVDSAGNPYSGGLLFFYVTGTSTKTNTYTTAALAVANANPVVLDSAGRAIDVFLDPAVTYKVVLAPSTDTDPPTAAIATADPVVDLAANVTAVVSIYPGNPNTHVAGSQGAQGGVGASIVWDSVNQIFYICTTTGVAAGAVWTSIVGSFAGSISFSSAITPAALGANTNDWAPAGFSSAYTVRASASAAYNLTGIAGGAAGREILLSNIGSFTITLVGNSASSSAANRLLLGSDVALLTTEAIALSYDVTSAGWRPKAPPQRGMTTIASGSLSGATVTLTGIPATCAYLVLYIAGGSSDTATRQVYVQVSTNNGSSYDATAANYAGVWERAGTDTSMGSAGVGAFPVPTMLLASSDIAAAATFTGTLVLKSYQGGPNATFESFYTDGTNQTVAYGRYIGSVSAINALKILLNGAGSFDAGTYALYGVY